MRNLKRALSLVLATVMTMGLMMVGTGASYADVEATDNVEAIEVLQAVGIMTGDENGDFNPDANVTRNEIAVIMSNLLNLDYDYYRGVNPFTDVPDWAAPYVAACAAEGVVAGIGGTLYGGSNNVTAAQAALMIMKALGYFQYQADFDTDWQIATIRQASYINLFDGINANAETALTRNQIAQLVLNGLKANMVTFTGTVGAEINGVSIGYKAEYTPITNASSKYNRIDVGTTNIASDDKYYVQLGEELYNGDLQLKDDVDVFGRPARYWEYDGKEIGTYVNTDLMIQEYTVKVTGDMLYDLLTRNTVNTYALTVVIDGLYEEDGVGAGFFSKNQINRNNDDTLGNTGNGVLTQVFVDNEEDTITIAIINTYLALATKDYDSKRDDITFNVYGINAHGSDYYKDLTAAEDKRSMTVSGEDFDIENLVEDDAVLVTVADGEIQTIADCEVIAGTEVEAFESSANNARPGTPSALVIDGTDYKFADAAEFDYQVMEYYTGMANSTNLKDITYNVYLDAYGYVIGVEEVESVDNYLFITGIDTQGSNQGNRNATATAIFLDGTMKSIDINMVKSTFQSSTTVDDGNANLNAWFTYTVNTSDVYTVKEVSNVDVRGENYIPYPANGPVNNNTNSGKIAQYHETVAGATGTVMEINSKNITLQGQDTAATTYTRVYGTDDTVYLTVSLGELVNGGLVYGYIDDVESVVTGIDNANLEVWADVDVADKADDTKTTAYKPGQKTDGTTDGNATVASGVYTLYDRDGDVIAAVVVGEDAGTTKNLVYAHTSSIYRESYNKTTGVYTWTRKVISNGEEILLTETSTDGVSELDTMTQHTWWQVKYNAEGNVIEVNRYDGAGLTANADYVEDIDNLYTAINTEDTVLYYSNPGIDYDKLYLSGKSLWLDGTLRAKGFRVSEDVKTVLIQINNNVTKTYYETGINGLQNVIDDLNERHEGLGLGSGHDYVVSAIIEKGIATSIIIRDPNTSCDPYNDGNWEVVSSGKLAVQGLSFGGQASGMEVTFQNKTGNAISAGATITVVVKNAETGTQVYAGPIKTGGFVDTDGAAIVGTLAANDYGVAVFNYNTIPGNSGKYTVELTIVDGTDTYVGTATLATA